MPHSCQTVAEKCEALRVVSGHINLALNVVVSAGFRYVRLLLLF